MPRMALNALLLFVAICCEVVATSALKATDGFTRPLPMLICLVGYGLAFYLLSLVLRTMPVGIAYAVWAGTGMVLIAAAGWLFYRQPLDAPAVVGIALIVAGVAVINLFSRTLPH
jgi:small multidrug resistance pump